MFKYFILRDTRLEGNLPFLPAVLIASEVGPSVPLSNAFTRIKTAFQQHGKMTTLFILCHGKQDRLGPFRFGGLGLTLGKEDLKHNNVAQWAAIKDMFDSIVVYACGAAYSGPIPSSSVPSDGQGLMSALAKYTNALVFAGEQTQWYYPKDFNFGKWEGQVYMFFPTGQVMPVVGPPTEVIDVISPIPEGKGFLGKYTNDAIRNARRNR